MAVSATSHTLTAPLVLTSGAVKKIKQLMDEEGNPTLKLRVFVQGGGCSGYQYGFTFDEETDEGDTAIHFPLAETATSDTDIISG